MSRIVSHAADRLKERYGYVFTHKLERDLLNFGKTSKIIKMKRINRTECEMTVKLDGVFFEMIYDTKRKRVVTFLTTLLNGPMVRYA